MVRLIRDRLRHNVRVICRESPTSRQSIIGFEPSHTGFVLESSESDIPGAATLILSASTHRAGMGTTVKTERGEQVTTGNRTRVVRLAVTNANNPTFARLAQSVEHGTLNPRVVGSSPTLGATVKTERGEQVTTGNRTRVVRLAVTKANHYTKRDTKEAIMLQRSTCDD
ncbi:hypothetical protein Bbelb_144590 [Branchiostoma belcheri]|nr:hypothetical protein Bbelb_144590 [Branchiostoma belcheri]